MAGATPDSQGFYLRHLDRCNEILGVRLGTIHNLHYYLTLMRRIRAAIAAGTLESLERAVRAIPERAGQVSAGTVA